MRKTSVYLPDELKDSLTALARRWDRSEADLLRLAVERLLDGAHAAPSPAVAAAPPFAPGPRLVGVGVGPGDPSLVTAKAVAALKAASRVFAPAAGVDAIGRAEAVVRTVAPEVVVDRLALDITGSPKARAASLDRASAELLTALEAGAPVVFATLGDPMLWSTFPALARRVQRMKPGLVVEAIPGVLAYQDVAGRTASPLAETADDEVLLLAVDDDEAAGLESALAAEQATRSVVVVKGGGHLPAVATALERHGRLEHAVMGELLGLPGGRTSPVAAVADRRASYLASIVVPAAKAER